MGNAHRQSAHPHQKPAPFVDLNAEVARLIASQKIKQAVELAKDNHKRVNTPDSEKLLVDTYIKRIGQFRDKGQTEDARTLIALVKERFPSHAGELGILEINTAATGGLVDELVAALGRPDVSDAQRDAIETAIRQRLTDPKALAETKSLPAGHPLKVGAAAVWRSFEAVTSGPVSDEQIALPEISRKSPLSGWRMLIRAIAALHRNDPEASRRALEAIPPDAAVAQLVVPVQDMLAGSAPVRGAVGALQSRINHSDGSLQKALERLEVEFRSRYLDVLNSAMFNAIRTCDIARPELTAALRIRIAARCVFEEVPFTEILGVVNSIPLESSFWRLMANAADRGGLKPAAVVFWERFVRHGIAEQQFSATSLEVAMVYLRMAEILSPMSVSQLSTARKMLQHSGVPLLFYKHRPREIADLAPDMDQMLAWALDPDELFRRSTRIMPDGESFRKWAARADSLETPVKFMEDIYQDWQKALPRDPEPILHLSHLAEQRDALTLATKRLLEAEAIDPFNPLVRKARVRLTLAILWRHMKAAKPRLVEKDIAELEALPQFGDGDFNAFLHAVKSSWHELKNEPDQARSEGEIVVEKLGAAAGPLLLHLVDFMRRGDKAGTSRLVSRTSTSSFPILTDVDPLTAAQADARIRRLASALWLKMLRPEPWDRLILQVLLQRPCPLSLEEVMILGVGANINKEPKQAYAASTVAIEKSSAAALARALLLRGQAAGHWSNARFMQCLRAAMALAQQFHDSELMAEISRVLAAQPTYLRGYSDGKPLEPQTLAEVLTAERAAPEVPRSSTAAGESVVVIDPPAFGGGFFDPTGGDYGDDDDDDYEDEDEEDDEFDNQFDALQLSQMIMTPEMLPLLTRLLEEFGRIPDLLELEQSDPKLARELREAMEKAIGRKR